MVVVLHEEVACSLEGALHSLEELRREGSLVRRLGITFSIAF